MEFTTGGRLEVRITAADTGKRVSVRRLSSSGTPGSLFTDTVGVLTSWDDGVLSITRKSGETVRIDESALVAGKVVPAAPARRRGPAASFEELAPVLARAWQPVESERLGALDAAGRRRIHPARELGRCRSATPACPLPDALRVRARLVRGPRAARLRPGRDGRRGHPGAALRGS